MFHVTQVQAALGTVGLRISAGEVCRKAGGAYLELTFVACSLCVCMPSSFSCGMPRRGQHVGRHLCTKESSMVPDQLFIRHQLRVCDYVLKV